MNQADILLVCVLTIHQKKFILVSDLSLEEIKTGSLVGIEPRVTYLKPALQLNYQQSAFNVFSNSIDVDRRHRLERATVDSGWPFGDRMQSTND